MAFIPYVFYLVKQKNPIFLPALIVYVTPGTTITYAILFSTLVITFANLSVIKKTGLIWAFILTLFPVPVFLYLTIQRLVQFGDGLVSILTPLDYYLGLFPFFYGVLMADKFDNKSVQGLLITLFILPTLAQLGIFDISIRIYWLSYPVFMVIFIGTIIMFSQKKTINKNWFLLSSIFLILNSSPQFTVLFSGIVAIVVFYYKLANKKILFSFFTSWKIILIFLLITSLVISNSDSAIKSINSQNSYLNEASYYESWSTFKEKFFFKAFGDRAPLWVGGWNVIKQQQEFYFFPPTKPFVYTLQTVSGNEFNENEMAMHNLLLELMRNYGLFYGFFIFFIFLYMCIISIGKFISSYNGNNLQLLFIATGTLGSAFVGSLVGQYPLMGSFSICMISIFGIFFGLNRFSYLKLKG